MKWFVLVVIVLNGCITTKTTIKSDELLDYVSLSFSKAREIQYTAELEEDNWQSPQETESVGKGDCEDKSFYLMYLLCKKNVKSKVVIGLTSTINPRKDLERGSSLHAWNEVDIGGETYVMDPTSGCFRLKSSMAFLYKWDITQDPVYLRVYKEKIESYRLKNKDLKCFENCLKDSFL